MPTEGFSPFDDYGSDASIRGLVAGQKVFNRYTLKRVLGRGGMGVVWLVHDDQLERDIAFKFLPDIVYHDKAAVESLKRETRRSLELTHPNIVRIYDFAQDEHCAGISMEYVAGDTLSNLRVCQPTHVFEVSDLEKWVRQLCLALEYAHKEARVAHRDLKPANLMLNNRGVLKIADFGISRSISDNMTRVSSAVHGASGTLVYMSPQQALGEAASALDDIYSLGATIFELLTSKPPFFTGEIMTQVREKIPPTLAERRKQLGIESRPIPPEWEETVAACLAKDPKKRPQSALEVLQRLGLADTAGMEAAGLTTTHTVAVPTEPKPADDPSQAPTEPMPLMGLEGSESRTTTRPPQPPMEFVLDSKGFKPAALADEKAPQTTRRQRIARRSVAAMLVILVAFVGGLSWWVGTGHQRLKSGMGGIEIRSLPSGAVLTLADGREVKGPGKLMNLPPGEYQALVEMTNHEPQMFQLKVEEGKFALLPEVKLQPHVGKVLLISDPPGARFTVDGKKVSAGEAVEMAPGDHEIIAEYKDWSPVRRLVTIAKDSELKEVFQFYPGTVKITSDPSGAKVFLGGKEVGTTPYIAPEVQPGGVLYVLVKDDFNPESVKGEVRANELLPLHRVLTKEQGTLLLSSSAPGVTFWVDGRSVGQVGDELQLETKVSPGRHEITAYLPGWPKQERTVEIAKGKINELEFEFQPAAVVITSEPPGAIVIHRGTSLEKTPFTLKGVKPGPVSLLLQMDGFDPVTVDTNVLSGETLALHVVLPRMSRPFRIKTVPPDALLAVDGIWLTNRPPRFTVGKHVLRIEKEGYETKEVPVEIHAEGLNDFGEFELERTSGELQVMTKPASANFELFVNGVRKQGRTAERLKDIPTGKHRILIQAEGYEAQYLDVEILKDQPTITDEVVLVRSKGTMRILTTPPGAGYSIIGPDDVTRAGKTPQDEPNLPTGKYQVTFSLAGYDPTNLVVEVRNSSAAVAEAFLARSRAPLSVSANVKGARFKLHGPDGYFEEGTLPLKAPALATGEYELEVEMAGYDAFTQKLELKKGQPWVENVTLQRSQGALLAKIAPVEASAELRGAGVNKPVVSGSVLTDIPTGNYLLISRYKQWSVTNEVSIRSRQTNEVPVALPFGTVRIESTPPGALVMRDGKEEGVTPLTLSEQPAGAARFELRLPRHRFVDVGVTIQPQRTNTVRRNLEPYAGPQPGMTMWTNSLGMRFVPVGNIWVSVWETRVKDFQVFYDALRYNAGPGWRDPGFKQTPTEPVVEVSWKDARAFCEWLTGKEGRDQVLEQAVYRLPTQAEWRQILKSGHNPGNFLWGDAWPVPSGSANLAGNVSYDRHAFTAPAGSYPPSRNGIYDLIGNVWEWCEDGNGDNRQRTVMGESWLQYSGASYSPNANRSLSTDTKLDDVGFRVVLAPSPVN